MTGSGKEDSFSEAQYWFREVEQIVRWTREEAERLGIALPADFANTDNWRKSEADIEKAMFKSDYCKTRDLSRSHVVRAVNYCRRCLGIENAKGAA